MAAALALTIRFDQSTKDASASLGTASETLVLGPVALPIGNEFPVAAFADLQILNTLEGGSTGEDGTFEITLHEFEVLSAPIRDMPLLGPWSIVGLVVLLASVGARTATSVLRE